MQQTQLEFELDLLISHSKLLTIRLPVHPIKYIKKNIEQQKTIGCNFEKSCRHSKIYLCYEFSNVLQSLKDYGQCNQKKNLHMKKKNSFYAET